MKMANLYACLYGEKNPRTKIGHHNLSAHIRGWDLGVKVCARHTDNGDFFDVWQTSGSNGNTPDIFLFGITPKSPGEISKLFRDGAQIYKENGEFHIAPIGE
jgi:hypothetical protein